MADRQFTYKVDIDTASAKAAADTVRAMFADVAQQAERQIAAAGRRGGAASGSGGQDGTRGGGGGRTGGSGGGLAKIEKFREANARLADQQEADVRKLGLMQMDAEQRYQNEIRQTGLMRIDAENRYENEIRQNGLMRLDAERRYQAEVRQTGLMQLEAQRMNRQFNAGQLDGSGRPIAQKQGSSLDGVLKTGFLAYGAYIAGKQAVESTVEFGKVGAQQLRMVDTFKQLGDQIGVNAEEMGAAVKKATNSSISDMQAMQFSANILAQRFAAEIDDIEGDTATLATASRRLAQVYTDENGDLLSTEAVFSRLVKFAREGNKELVDQFGISNQLIADTLGISIDGLRGAEGATNRFKGMVMILNEELARLGQPVDSAADRMEQAFARMTTALDKFRQEAAEPVTIVVEWAAGAVDFAAVWLQGEKDKLKVYKALLAQRPSDVMGDEINRLDTSPGNLASKIPGLRGQRADELSGIGQRLENLPPMADRGNGEQMLQETEMLAGIAEMYIKLTDAQNGYVSNSEEGKAVLAGWVDLLLGWESGTLKTLPQIERAYDKLIAKMKELSDIELPPIDELQTIGAAAAAVRKQQADAKARTQALIAGEIAPEDLNEAEREYRMAVGSAAERVRIWEAVVAASVGDQEALLKAQAALEGAMLDLAGAMDAIKGEIRGIVGDIKKFELDMQMVGASPAEKLAIMQQQGGYGIKPGSAEDREYQLELANLEQSVIEENARLGKEAQAEWKRTAKEVERLFEAAADKIMSIPGVTSLTPVTEQEMLDTEFGAYQDKPDEWVRRVRDELTSFYRIREKDDAGIMHERLAPRVTKDYADVSREQVEALTGMAAGTPHDVMIPRLEKMWESGSLFADPANLGLMNMDAIRGSYNEMKAGETGRANQKDFIMKELGVSAQDAALITGTQAPIVQMLTGGQSEEEISGQIGGTLKNVMSLATEGVAFAKPLLSQWSSQFSTEETTKGLKALGKTAALGFFAGFSESIAESGFAQAIISAIKGDIAKSLAEMAAAS